MDKEELVKQLNAILDEMEVPLGKIRNLIIDYVDSHDKIDLYAIAGI